MSRFVASPLCFALLSAAFLLRDILQPISCTASCNALLCPLAFPLAHFLHRIMAPCFIIVHLLNVFRNVLQAMGVAVWALVSGIAEFSARVFMSRIAIKWIGADVLFIAEPASWLGAMLCVFLPYFYYQKNIWNKKCICRKLSEKETKR